jgi:hypothetical protein
VWRWGSQFLALAILIAIPTLGLWLGPAQAAPCNETLAGHDSTHAQTAEAEFFGRAIGQTFYAPDTIIQSISVWRYPLQRSYYPYVILYVTGVDSMGFPNYPVLQTGPVVLPEQYDDGVHPVRIDFALDPALVLPRRGLYFFAVKDYSCDDGIALLADSTNGYPEGRAWTTSPIWDCSTVGPAQPRPPMIDLIFKVVFCADTTTAVRHTSWGELKRRYR